MMLRISILIIVMIINPFSDENEIVQKWLQANQTFKNAKNTEDYLQAISHYEDILKKGIKNGHIYYNLGNAYYKAKRLDHAILNYKRAQIYIPNDPYLVENLKLAHTKLQQKVKFEKPTQQNTFRYLFFWHFNWKYDTRLLLFIVTYMCFWLLLIAKLLSWKIPFWNLFIPVTIFLLAIGCSVAYDSFEDPNSNKAILIGETIEIRKGDATTYELLYGEQKIPGGVEVRVMEERNNWSKIELPDFLYGWVQKPFIKKIYD
ncbi:tetratricopeptide repeat protein [Candidatus Uabimicrobium amorphum]|uniref:BatE protein n=1 Tax=Uabimicrobium amorphum TaxID=2596890 RepID=A0A5S9F3W5_UABAM|nr:tetratricopeptide repeat protein [Candidatus Uabimicrobium amorphum]BBM84902.1 BatE protein [Candidatus Uabimicrobium amorphum]